MIGKVHLVGAGPGDPGLITLRGLECLAEADVVVYDHLVDERVLSCVKPQAEIVYAGKSREGHTLRQEEINDLLVRKALEGKVVARLKGGDPFVFGRGGEEAEALAARGIPFDVVPGVTSAIAAPAYAGIPVTHRDFTSSLAIITGHEDPTKTESSIAWDKIATGVGTLVFLMGVANLPELTRKLIENGRDKRTPVALIRWGTQPTQQTLTGTLEDIAEKARRSDFRPPAVTVVGEVVGLRERLRWFDNRPLFGKRVLVTRSREQASHLSRLLRESGANPVELPTIEIVPPVDFRPMDEAIRDLAEYDWVIFTSANGVSSFFERVAALGLDARSFGRAKVCAIGPATADSLECHGIKADYVPVRYLSQEIVAGLKLERMAGKRVLLPRADIASPELTEGLRELGARTGEVVAYRTILHETSRGAARKLFEEQKVDIVTFASSSTATNLAALLDNNLSLLKNTLVACIGPVTAETAAKLGFKVDVVAREHTIPGLVKALEERFAGGRL
ncbi:MAG: uroporphyrinogen-III C-methyltransferase [Chloroflexi bacterium]|nr:uroporphyrinogen-III C-methyltransferase [Chloroflexota bacterium]